MSEAEQSELARLTVELLSAYVANNTVQKDELAGLIETIREALSGAPNISQSVEDYRPAVSVEDSIASPDHIISLIDGKPYKTLKRHLGNNGLSAEEYKARYKLPRDYPLVAPNYSEHRRNVAKNMGLGGKPTPGLPTEHKVQPVTETVEAAESPVDAPVSKSSKASSSKLSKSAPVKTKRSESIKAARKEPSSEKPAAAAIHASEAPQPAAESSDNSSETVKTARPARKMTRLKADTNDKARGEVRPEESPSSKPAARKKLGISVAAGGSGAGLVNKVKPRAESRAAAKSPSARSKPAAPGATAVKASSKRVSAKSAKTTS